MVLVVAVCLFASCSAGTAYHHFEHTAEDGWDKRDTFFFNIDTILRAGNYVTTLCIRTDATYPYRNLSVRATQIVKPRNIISTHTIDFNIIQENGTHNGNGITFYTYEMPLGTLSLHPGDSLLVKVAHNMRRELMPGITDVGLRVTSN